MGQSLAAEAGALAGVAFQLPSTFQAPQEPVAARDLAPYIVFCHPKRTDEWTKLTNQHGKIDEGEMFLVTKEKSYRLDPAKLGWLLGKQYWAETNVAGTELLAVSWKERPKPFKEHIEAVVLVYLEDRIIVPANVRFRSTKCPAAMQLANTLPEAATPEWGLKSPQHRETMVCIQPFARFYGDVSLAAQRTSRSTGLPYRCTTCSIKPTGPTEWRLLKAFSEAPESQKQLQDAANRYENQIVDITKKLVQ